jgi:hypothetical protein
MWITYMSRLLGALFDIGSSEGRKCRVPHEVLSAMELTPVPMCTHHSADEVGVVVVRSSIVDEVTRFDSVSGRPNCSSSDKSDKRGEHLHFNWLPYEK